MKQHDYEQRYRRLWNCASKCRIRIYDGCEAQAGMTVVLATELEDNEGTSVTSWAEHLATEIIRTHRISPSRLVLIEHYIDHDVFIGDKPQVKEQFDLVTFEIDARGELSYPKWTLFGKATIESWIGEPVGTHDRERGTRYLVPYQKKAPVLKKDDVQQDAPPMRSLFIMGWIIVGNLIARKLKTPTLWLLYDAI